jgi:hypothetical protein
MKPFSINSFSTRVQTLLGDLQDVEEFGDRQPGLPIDEMEHAMMGAAERVIRQDQVGVGRRNRDRRRRTTRSDRRPASAARVPPSSAGLRSRSAVFVAIPIETF